MGCGMVGDTRHILRFQERQGQSDQGTAHRGLRVGKEGIFPVADGQGGTFYDPVRSKIFSSEKSFALAHIIVNCLCQCPLVKACTAILRQLR